MRNKWIKRFFPLIVFLLLAPWPVAYAHNYANTCTTDVSGPSNAVRIEIAEESAAGLAELVEKLEERLK